MGERLKANIAGVVYTLIIGHAFLFVKLVQPWAPTMDYLAWRFAICSLGVLVPVLTGRVRLGVTLKELPRFIPLILFYPILYFFAQALSLQRIPSGEAGIIQATLPVFSLILARLFLKERAGGLQKLFMALSIAGVVFVQAMNGASASNFDLAGVLWMVLSTFSLAACNMFTRKLTAHYPNFTLTFMMALGAFIFFFPIALVGHLANGTPAALFAPLANWRFLVPVVYLAVLSTICTSMLNNYALKRLESGRMSVYTNAATVIMVLAGAIYLGEALHWYHILGTVAIITGVVGTNLCGIKTKCPPVPVED